MSVAEGFEEFVAVVEAGSVSGAAAAMELPRATVSRRLARLEERLGVRLLHRTTRRLTLTHPGETLYATAHRVVQAAREAEASVRRLDDVPRGTLRVSIPTGMPERLLAGWIGEFLSTCEEVRVEMIAKSEHVDLVAEGIDVALRGGPIADPSLVVKTLAWDAGVAVASPEYLSRHGTPEVPGDLAAHACIVGFERGVVPERRWPLTSGGSVEVSGRFAINQMGVRLEAARQGLGITLAVDRLARELLASGELVHVLADQVGRRQQLSLVYPERAFLEPKVRAFLDFFSAKISAVRR